MRSTNKGGRYEVHHHRRCRGRRADLGRKGWGAMSLVGTCSGHRERVAKAEGWRDGEATLVITEQKGLTFTGHLKRTNPRGDVGEPLGRLHAWRKADRRRRRKRWFPGGGAL